MGYLSSQEPYLVHLVLARHSPGGLSHLSSTRLTRRRRKTCRSAAAQRVIVRQNPTFVLLSCSETALGPAGRTSTTRAGKRPPGETTNLFLFAFLVAVVSILNDSTCVSARGGVHGEVFPCVPTLRFPCRGRPARGNAKEGRTRLECASMIPHAVTSSSSHPVRQLVS